MADVVERVGGEVLRVVPSGKVKGAVFGFPDWANGGPLVKAGRYLVLVAAQANGEAVEGLVGGVVLEVQAGLAAVVAVEGEGVQMINQLAVMLGQPIDPLLVTLKDDYGNVCDVGRAQGPEGVVEGDDVAADFAADVFVEVWRRRARNSELQLVTDVMATWSAVCVRTEQGASLGRADG